MGRAFFDQVDDELRGLLGPALRSYRSLRTGRLLKLWYDDPAVHFEVQMVARRWSPAEGPVLEVGLHLEHPDAGTNERVLGGLTEEAAAWRRRLPNAEAGPALGPRGELWRRVSELLEETGPAPVRSADSGPPTPGASLGPVRSADSGPPTPGASLGPVRSADSGPPTPGASLGPVRSADSGPPSPGASLGLDPELASEAAERLADYVRALWPLIQGPAEPSG